jgi:hypothetical protein
VATLDNDEDVDTAEELLHAVLLNAVKDEDAKREQSSPLTSLPVKNCGLSILQSLSDIAPFSYQKELIEKSSNVIEPRERRQFLLASVVRCGLIYAPKSGELWTEAGRLLINPVCRVANRHKASLCFKRACELTQQYGDAFFERIRASILPNTSSIGSSLEIVHDEDADTIVREATASSPNYGPCWTAVSNWVAFECRETSFALMKRAKRLILRSFSLLPPREAEEASSSLNLILRYCSKKIEEEQQHSFVDFSRLSEVFCDDLS